MRLTEFYKQHNPGKLGQVNALHSHTVPLTRSIRSTRCLRSMRVTTRSYGMIWTRRAMIMLLLSLTLSHSGTAQRLSSGTLSTGSLIFTILRSSRWKSTIASLTFTHRSSPLVPGARNRSTKNRCVCRRDRIKADGDADGPVLSWEDNLYQALVGAGFPRVSCILLLG